jgi:hypothetical protein
MLKQHQATLLYAHFCTVDDSDTLSASQFLLKLHAQALDRLPGYRAQFPPADPPLQVKKPWNDWAQLILPALRKALVSSTAVTATWYILVDALDESIAASSSATEVSSVASLLAKIRQSLPLRIGLIVLSRRERFLLEQFETARVVNIDPAQGMADVFVYFRELFNQSSALQSKTKAEHAALATDATKQLCRALPPSDETAMDWAAACCSRFADGNFLVASLLADTLRYRPTAVTFRRLVLSVPLGLGAKFSQFFHLRYPDPATWKLVSPLLTILVSGRRSRDEVQACFRVATGATSTADFFNSERLLLPFLSVESDQLALYHSSLVEWLTDEKRSGQFAVSPVDATWYEACARACCLVNEQLFRGLSRSSGALNVVFKETLGHGILLDLAVPLRWRQSTALVDPLKALDDLAAILGRLSERDGRPYRLLNALAVDGRLKLPPNALFIVENPLTMMWLVRAHGFSADVPVLRKGPSLALHHRALSGHCLLFHTLLRLGASINARDSAGRTALYWACFAGNAHMTKVLLDQGAQILPGRGRLPFQVVAHRLQTAQFTDVIRLLHLTRTLRAAAVQTKCLLNRKSHLFCRVRTFTSRICFLYSSAN